MPTQLTANMVAKIAPLQKLAGQGGGSQEPLASCRATASLKSVAIDTKKGYQYDKRRDPAHNRKVWAAGLHMY